MKKFNLLILYFLFSTIKSDAQIIEEILLSLPAEFTPELTETAKDSLLQFSSYTIPGDDPREIMEVAITEKSKEFIQLTYSFTTGQRAFVIIQIRVFRKRDDKPLIVYAKFGGLPRAFDQHILKTYNFSNGFLVETKEKLSKSIGVKEFLKPKVVDEFAFDLEIMSTSYELNPEEKNSIEYKLESQIIYGKGEIENLIQTYDFLFTWNGETFILKDK